MTTSVKSVGQPAASLRTKRGSSEEEIKPANHDNLHRRIFVGPMPEKVVSHTDAQVRVRRQKTNFFHRTSSVDVGNDVSQVIKENAFRFFLHQGGQVEHWDEDEEQSTIDEMMERWKNSEWGALWTHRKENPAAARHSSSRWVGGSFEIGRLLGVNIIKEPELENKSSSRSVYRSSMSATLSRKRSISAGQETFLTAPSQMITPAVANGDHLGTTNNREAESNGDASTPAESSTGLLASTRKGPHITDAVREDILRQTSAPVLTSSRAKVVSDIKQKGKAVHYADLTEKEAPGPAPPSEVLERDAGTLEATTSAAASKSSPSISPMLSPESSTFQWGGVILRDRMLVRVSYSKSEILVDNFNDSVHRTTKNLHFEDWAEFLVAWRKDSIELYEDYSLPGREWVKGHKRLAYVIPLRSSRTRLSLYSFVDLTFCITCPPTTTRINEKNTRWIFSRTKEGTNIFVFKVKSRSRAYDWTWQLWRELGGALPKSIDIRNPTLDTKVTINIPDIVDSEKFKLYGRDNIIAMCIDSLRSVPDWNSLLEQDIIHGKHLELAWRVDATLDWIWLEDDIHGNYRDSGVLCGLPFRKGSKPPVLEIRLALHYPSHLHLRNGKRLEEPPAIEGYVERIRPNTQSRQQLYLVTHDGYLFTSLPNNAYTPAPPGMVLNLNDLDEYSHSLRHSEVVRGTNQLMHAMGVCDLRAIVAVRRAFQANPPYKHTERDVPANDDTTWLSIWAESDGRIAEDHQDEGGEEVLSKASDKVRLRIRRSFELLLANGRVVRLETHSCRVALEWIDRLRALIYYWRERHHIDAKEELELAQAARPRLTPQTRVCHEHYDSPPDPPGDLSAPYMAMNSLYNWCALDGCKPIIKGGKVFVRKGLRGPYKLVQLFLIKGHLVHFQVLPNSSLSLVEKKMHLLDAYVCSGYNAALALPEGEYQADGEAAPRRYQDGLEADDRDEDMLFVISYRSRSRFDGETTVIGANKSRTSMKAVPNLSSKRKLMIIRTRSKLERDAWCWALNCEIEKVVREQMDREERVRESGNLVNFECQ